MKKHVIAVCAVVALVMLLAFWADNGRLEAAGICEGLGGVFIRNARVISSKTTVRSYVCLRKDVVIQLPKGWNND